MRKFLLLFIVLLFAIVFDLSAQNQLNGKNWQNFSVPEKVCFIAGLNEGILLTSSVSQKATNANIIAIMRHNAPLTLSYHDQCKKLDEFYSEKRNLNIPVTSALIAVKMIVDKEPMSKVEDLKAKMRMDYN